MLSNRTAHISVNRLQLRDWALRLYLDEWSYRQIGKELGVSDETAGVYIHAGLCQLGASEASRHCGITRSTGCSACPSRWLRMAMGEGRTLASL